VDRRERVIPRSPPRRPLSIPGAGLLLPASGQAGGDGVCRVRPATPGFSRERTRAEAGGVVLRRLHA
jgi:hypothetical protein